MGMLCFRYRPCRRRRACWTPQVEVPGASQPGRCRRCCRGGGTAGEDVAASTAAGSRAASASGRPPPPPGLLQYLLLRLQCQMPSVRFGCAEQSHNENKAGDVLEAVGGFLRPWNKRAEVVSVTLGREYGWREDEVQDALRSLTNFTEAASFLWAHASADKAEFASLLSRFGGSPLGDFSAAGCDCITCAVRP